MARRGHLKVGKRRKAKPSRGSDQQLQLLAQLKDLAGQTGIEVREERLHREIGYTVRGGRCILDGNEVLLIDSSASAADCIEVLLDFLSQRDLEQIYIEPQLRRLISGGHAGDTEAEQIAQDDDSADAADAVDDSASAEAAGDSPAL